MLKGPVLRSAEPEGCFGEALPCGSRQSWWPRAPAPSAIPARHQFPCPALSLPSPTGTPALGSFSFQFPSPWTWQEESGALITSLGESSFRLTQAKGFVCLERRLQEVVGQSLALAGVLMGLLEVQAGRH